MNEKFKMDFENFKLEYETLLLKYSTKKIPFSAMRIGTREVQVKMSGFFVMQENAIYGKYVKGKVVYRDQDSIFVSSKTNKPKIKE